MRRHVLLAAPFVLVATLFAQESGKSDIPHVSADAGPCFVNFTVSDSSSKPLYAAQISGQVRYGFHSLRRVDLQISTNSDGKARIDGLPERTKKPIAFTVKHGDLSTAIDVDPAANCHLDQNVKLAK